MLQANRRAEITRLNGVYQSLLVGAGVMTLLRVGPRWQTPMPPCGLATRPSPRNTSLVATGGRPVVADVPGRELVLTSDDYLFDLTRFPGACWWWAAATSPVNLLPSSTAWAAR